MSEAGRRAARDQEGDKEGEGAGSESLSPHRLVQLLYDIECKCLPGGHRGRAGQEIWSPISWTSELLSHLKPWPGETGTCIKSTLLLYYPRLDRILAGARIRNPSLDPFPFLILLSKTGQRIEKRELWVRSSELPMLFRGAAFSPSLTYCIILRTTCMGCSSTGKAPLHREKRGGEEREKVAVC